MADYDVVVAGAGFAGLACARELAGRGLEVLVLEKKPRAADHIHTTGILVKEAQEEWAAPKALVREIKRVRVYGPSLRSAAVERDEYFFLATDAAGMVSPLTAGGIHRAYLCGRLAGQAIADYLLQGGPHPGGRCWKQCCASRWYSGDWRAGYSSTG